MIHAGAEDAEEWRPVAERLTGFTVVTYDRRGTLRSGCDDWPGGGSAQHADDASGLVRAVGLDDVLVFGCSSGGNIALQLALRHPDLVRRALIWEPGYIRQVPGGDEAYRRMREAGFQHLAAHPDDWPGAYAAVLRSLSLVPDQATAVSPTASHRRSWYDEREDGNAEALMRDDIPIITGELVDEEALARTAADIRFAFGARTRPLFRAITRRLAHIRGGTPDVVPDVGHVIVYEAETAADYIRAQTGVATTRP